MPKKKLSRKAVNIIVISLMCVFAVIFVVSAVMLAGTMREYARANELYNKVHEDFINGLNNAVTRDDGTPDTAIQYETRNPNGGWDILEPDYTTSEPSDTEEPGDEENPDENGEDTDDSGEGGTVDTTPSQPLYSDFFLSVRKKITEYQQINEDIFGYILIEFGENDTISYPLVQGKDNYYYVDHAYDKSELRAGSIFLDYRNRVDLRDAVSVLYGHNMNNKSMFAKLYNFKQQHHFDNTKITVYTMYGIYTYEVFSIYNTDMDSDYAEIYFDNRDQYLEHLNTLKSRSILQKDIVLNKYDKILTLSTCLNTYNSGRLAVHAVLVGIAR